MLEMDVEDRLHRRHCLFRRLRSCYYANLGCYRQSREEILVARREPGFEGPLSRCVLAVPTLHLMWLLFIATCVCLISPQYNGNPFEKLSDCGGNSTIRCGASVDRYAASGVLSYCYAHNAISRCVVAGLVAMRLWIAVFVTPRVESGGSLWRACY